MIKSFRLRLALLTLLLTGVALGAFAASTWWLIIKLQNERLDSEIRTQVERVAGRMRMGIDWSAPISRISDDMHIENPQYLIVLQQDATGETLFKSPHWPLGLPANTLPWPDNKGPAVMQWPTPRASQWFDSAQQSRFISSNWLPSEHAAARPTHQKALTSCSPPPHRSRPPTGQRPPRNPPNQARPLPGSDASNSRGERLPIINPNKTPQLKEPASAAADKSLPPVTLQRPTATPQPALTGQAPASETPANMASNDLGNSRGEYQLPLSPAVPAVIATLPLQLPTAVTQSSLDHQSPNNTTDSPPINAAMPEPRSTRNMPPPPGSHPPPAVHASVIVRSIDGQQWRIGLVSTPSGYLALGVNAQVLDNERHDIRNAFLAALPFALIFISASSWLVASRAMRPLRTLTQAARSVTAEGLYQRIADQGEDREFGEVIEMFNGMLARLERSFKQAHRFSADAAHELQTPLTILQGQLELAINSVDDGSPIQASLADILDEVRRLSGISRKLLLLSQADAGRLRIQAQPFELSKTLHELLEDAHMLAPHLQVTGLIPADITVSADASLLRQALHNLLSNAIKYNLKDGWVRISVQIKTNDIVIRLSNSAADIPEKERNKLFERFFRVDSSHSRSVDGTGLGLSLAKEIAKAHGGDLVFVNSAQGSVTFSLRLPKPTATQ